MAYRLLIIYIVSLSFFSCSTMNKKDCSKNMLELGLLQGRTGSPRIYTDELRKVCQNINPAIDLALYEKGFYQGWNEYCLPDKAFDMGKRSDRYISFCPEDREKLFREKYLIGKHYAELKDEEEELQDAIEEIRSTINESSARYDDYLKLQQGLEKIRRDMQALEVEGLKNTFKFR